MSISFSYLVTGLMCLGYLALLFFAFRVRPELRRAGLLVWTISTLVVSFLGQAIFLLVSNAHLGPYASLFVGGLTQPAVATLLASLSLVLFTALTFRYLQRPIAIGIFILGLLWWFGAAILCIQTPDKNIAMGVSGWIRTAFSSPADGLSLLILGGWAGLALIGLLAIIYSFVRAELPEVANRALFWLMVFPIMIVGVIVGASGSDFLKEIGWVIRFAALGAALYGVSSHRVFDVRRVFRFTFTSGLGVALLSVVVFIALAIGFNLEHGPSSSWLVLIGLAIAVALAYLPLRALTLALMSRMFGKPPDDPTTIVRQYSQDIAAVVELKELSDVAIDTLRKTLRVRRGGLILATRDDNDTIRLEPMQSNLSEMPEIKGWLPKGNAIHHMLFDKRVPLQQYDLEYAREYADVAPELKSFFKQLRMSAYAPIVVQGQLIGVLAASTKANDDPFSPQDLELLSTIATQNGVALRNARLVSDLRKARDETEALNQDIIETKERLEQLDSVKTDFITIASHELRTPLAQIRGYTDILEAVSDSAKLDPDQIVGITNNLRKATDRLERLIADMLDVSQLGLDAMDLRFASTTIDNVIRLAIEPLTESIKQRKLSLTARHLKGLPAIEADMQRLVQAFRNIVLNAIKYTPDGGRIDITGKAQKNEQTGQDEIVVSIQDSGIGIDARFHDLIFEKFFRIADPGLHSTGATKFMGAGPGLGLTIARGVVQGHGGKIWVESPGHDMDKLPGTTVHVLLPLNPPANAKRVMTFEKTATQTTKTVQPTVPTN